MDLLAALAIIRRRWPVILLCLVAGLAGGFDLAHHTAKKYSTSAQCLLSVPAAGNVQDQLAGSQLSSNLATTYSKLVDAQVVTEQVSKQLAAQGFPATAAGLSASVEPNTYLIDVKATKALPIEAQATANEGARALVAAVAKLQQGVPEKISVQIVNQASLPTSPVSPRPKLDVTVGGILGLLAGLALAAALEALDRTIKSVSQADTAVSAPLLGLVPKRRGGALVVGLDDGSGLGEPYRTLRTAIRFLDPGKPIQTLLVTSPTPDDGKTTTAANLAVALALSGERVIAVDADLRRAGLATAFGLDRSVGLTSLVLGTATLDEALQDWGPRLQVLATGPLPPNPSEILGSELTSQLVEALAERADVVVIDAPPILPVADAVNIATQVDGLLMVVRYGRTLRTSASAARRRLDSVGARTLGYVLNAAPPSESRGYYADYRYRYQGPREQPPPESSADQASIVDMTPTRSPQFPGGQNGGSPRSRGNTRGGGTVMRNRQRTGE